MILRPVDSSNAFRPLHICAIVLFVWCGSAFAAQAPGGQKSVLLIADSGSNMAGNIVVDQTIRKALGAQFGLDVDIQSEYLNLRTLAEEDYSALLSWLRRKYTGSTFDVVMAVGTAPLGFVGANHHDFFGGARIVFFGRRSAMAGWTSPPLTGVVAPEMETQVRGLFDFIRGLQPDVEQVAVVSGAESLDRTWEAAAKRELRAEDRVAVTYLSALTVEDMLSRLALLPPKTAVLFLTMNEDGAGRHLLRQDVLSVAVQRSAAPVYTTSALYLDIDIIGGALLNQEQMAAEAAGLIGELLRDDTLDLPIREASLTPMVNWRGLRRWGIPESALPDGTVVVHKDPSMWSMYKWRVIGGLSLCIVEGLLIVALLAHRARRKRAEKELRESKQLLQSAIDALDARIALMDQDGKIIAANQPWLRFADMNPPAEGLPGNSGLHAPGSCGELQLMSGSLRRLMSGELTDFRCVYPLRKGDKKAWFQVRMRRFNIGSAERLVIAHEDVTEIQQAHDTQQRFTGLLLRAQDEERRCIARDLHDASVQDIATIKADISRVLRSVAPGPAADKLSESVSLADQVIKDLRTLSYVLHPPLLDQAGLTAALQWFVRGFSERSGVRVELLAKQDIGRLSPNIELALFRVVQESLTNIHRHSGSATAVIELTKGEKGVVFLNIIDHGRGFPTAAIGNSEFLPGVGIEGMRQRLKQLGGELEIQSGSKGTTITATISTSQKQYAAIFGS